jgi:AcrR family transcriptional regulator
VLTTQGQERKQQLLDSASQLFAERGYAETRVIDIVRAAGVAKGLFYWYFENKEAVFRELAENIRHEFRVHQSRAMDPDADALVQLRQATEASVHFMARHAPFFALIETENVGQPLAELVRRGAEIHAADSARLLAAGQEAGLVRDEDPLLLAYGVVGAVGYYCHLHRTGRISITVDELARFVARSVVRTLAADEASARRVEQEAAGARV